MKNSYNQFKHLIRSFRWNSIFVKYFKRFFCTILIPFILIACLLVLYVNTNLRHEQEKLRNEAIQKNLYIFNSVFENINNQHLIFNTNSNVITFFSTDTIYSSTLEARQNTNALNELFTSTQLSSNYVDKIYFVNFATEYVFTSNGGTSFSDLYGDNLNIVNTYRQNKQNFFIIPDSSKFTVVYEYQSFGIPQGLIAFRIDLARIVDQFILSAGDINLISKGGVILYSSVPSHIGKTYSVSQISPDTPIALDYYNLSFVSKEYPADTKAVRHHNLIIFAVCFCLLLLIPTLISFYMSYLTYNSITKIISLLGDTDTPSTAHNDELSYIALNIKNMFTRQHELEAELASRMFQLKKMQTLTLQTQLNPHFLFNTINLAIINEVKVTRKDTTVSIILGLLSKLLRISLDTKNYIVTVSEELDYTKTYLDILSIRYNNNFDIEYNIDENTKHLKTVKLSLQPIIENAFEHGISGLTGDKRGLIKISSENFGSYFKISVYNNGIPCDPEVLENLRRRLETENFPSSEHIGLSNVNARIKLLFGVQYGCSISSDTDGTVCTLTLPTIS